MKKNGMIVWNVVLTLVAGWLLFLQLGGGGATGKLLKTRSDAPAGPFRMAYF